MTPIRRHIDSKRVFDVLVVGGGITGAAVAYEAASAGLSVALVEKDDFGGATSAATGKLIHGGLRYLKNFELGLVRESLAERRTLSIIAPGLVVPFPMVLPEPGLIEHLGLTAYDVLSFDRNRVPDDAQRIPAHRTMSHAELARHGLGHLESAILYYDAMMPSPERLTLAFLRSAVAAGAQVLNHAPVERLVVRRDRVRGALVEVNGERRLFEARVVVNATGPWAHDLLDATPETRPFAGPRPPVRSEGIYLVTRKLSDIMVLYVSEHGHFSFAPWRGHSLIGPTETPYRGDVDDWRLSAESVDAFLTHINRTSRLPEPLRREDVVAAYGGLRPLVESTGDDTYGASRASEVVDHGPAGLAGIVSATGGKYTTSRAFAVKVRHRIDEKLGRDWVSSRTHLRALDACDIGPLSDYVSALAVRHPQVAPETIRHLSQFYGTDADAVLALAAERPELGEVLDEDGEILAQVVFAARYEAAHSLADVLLRRTGLGLLGALPESTLERVGATLGQELGWSNARQARELDEAHAATTLPRRLA